MALQLSNTTKNKILNNVFRQQGLYVMIPTIDGALQSADLPREEITFNVANNGRISLAAPVQFAVQAGTTINNIYLDTNPLTNETTGEALVRIDLTGDDIETYDSNGVYNISAINVAVNT